ncbi:MAG: hypothetical protein ABIW31_06865 [Novosphingobium sp.]
MADEFFSRAATPAPARRSAKGIILTVLLAFLLGAGVLGYLAWSGLLPKLMAGPDHLLVDGGATATIKPVTPVAQPVAAAIPAPADTRQDALELRLAALEQRLTQIDLRTEASSGNTARAEGLLIAFAARRALDRGAQLGGLEDQLRLRFADAQPNAVATLIDTGRKPVTLGQLIAGLDSLSPSLSATPAAQLGAWDKLKSEMANLFVVRHDTSPSASPAKRLDRARIAMEAGRIEEAVAEVERLPGAGDANVGASAWITEARRYAKARDALDLIETTALLDSRNLRDGAGKQVEQVSPVAN